MLLAQSSGSFWLPQEASDYANQVDWLLGLIYAVSLFFMAVITGVGIYFVVRYRRRPGHRARKTAAHNTPLELLWSGIPLILVIIIFSFGMKAYVSMSTPPADAYEITVEAKRWSWLFIYPNGVPDNNLHVPVNTPVRLVLTSDDVIHGFYIPAFRIKRDVVPGRYNKVWFRATKVGEFNLFCAEYCGTKHSEMIAKVIVQEKGQFDNWLRDAADLTKSLPPAEAGQKLFHRYGCQQCHSVDGTANIGPTLLGAYGRTEKIKGGESLVVNEDYIRESILEPNARIVQGYDKVAAMPTFKGRIKDNEITAIIAYLKTLKK